MSLSKETESKGGGVVNRQTSCWQSQGTEGQLLSSWEWELQRCRYLPLASTGQHTALQHTQNSEPFKALCFLSAMKASRTWSSIEPL